MLHQVALRDAESKHVELGKRNECCKRYELMRKNALCSSNNPQCIIDTKNWKNINAVKTKAINPKLLFCYVIQSITSEG